MTPAHAIAALDRQLAEHGEPVSLKLGDGAAVSVPAFVRDAKREPLAAGISQSMRRVTLSPTGLQGVIPKVDDQIRIGAEGFSVLSQAPEVIRIGSTVVRVNIWVTG